MHKDFHVLQRTAYYTRPTCQFATYDPMTPTQPANPPTRQPANPSTRQPASPPTRLVNQSALKGWGGGWRNVRGAEVFGWPRQPHDQGGLMRLGRSSTCMFCEGQVSEYPLSQMGPREKRRERRGVIAGWQLGQIFRTRAESQRIVAARPLCRLQYPVRAKSSAKDLPQRRLELSCLAPKPVL